MRIAFAVNSIYFLRSHRRPLVARAVELGWDVHLVCGPDADERDLAARTDFQSLGCTIHDIPLTRSGTGPADLAKTTAALTALFRSIRPAIVHNITPKLVTLGSIAARRAQVPAVVNAISGLGFMFSGTGLVSRVKSTAARAFYALALRHPNQAIIVQNDRDRQALESLSLPTRTRFHHFYGSGVDLGTFCVAPLPSGVPVVVLAARLLRDKGIPEFAEAARILRQRGVAARFVLCGSLDPGNPAALTQSELDVLVSEGVVEYWGQRSDMARVYAQATVASLPSYYGEGLPLTLAEAAACGRAIVTTDLPGCRDTVIDGESGYLVPPRDGDALAVALAELVQSPSLAAQMGSASRSLAEKRFNVAAVVAGHFEIYEQLVTSQAKEPM
jgi:glycosyltransferase involved in cell wall biosynthesis